MNYHIPYGMFASGLWNMSVQQCITRVFILTESNIWCSFSFKYFYCLSTWCCWVIRMKLKHSVASQCEGESLLFDGQKQKLVLPWCHLLSASVPPQVSVCLCTKRLTTSCLCSPWRKRQLQFLLDGRGRRAGLSPEELRDNGKLLGEGLSRALFNYPSRDCSADSPEVSSGFLLQFLVLKQLPNGVRHHLISRKWLKS